MTRVSSSIPIVKDLNKPGFKGNLDGFFNFKGTRFLLVENRGKGQLVLRKCEVPVSCLQKGIKIALMFTGIVPLLAAMWAMGRKIHVMIASRKWTVLTDMPVKETLVGHPNGAGAILKWPKNPIAKHSGIKNLDDSRWADSKILPKNLMSKHSGIKNPNSLCWLDSEIQIVAHFKHLRDLFSLKKNPIARCANETEEAFVLRQEIQFKGNLVIQFILKGGSPIDSINELGLLLEKAGLIQKRDEFFKINVMQDLPTKLTAYLKQEIEEEDATLTTYTLDFAEFPEVPPRQILFHADMLGDKEIIPNELTPKEGGPSYTLQGATSGKGHFRAFVRGEDGNFVIFNDARVKATKDDFLVKAPEAYYYYVRNP